MKTTHPSSNESSEQCARNVKALAAWNQFYDTCSFFRCEEEKCLLLCKTVYRYFKTYVCGCFPSFESQFDDPGFMGDFARFLEEEIEKHQLEAETAEKTNLSDEKGRKRYKDYIWTRARDPRETPLRVIRGMMLRGQNSILVDAAEKYLRKEFVAFDIQKGKPDAIVVDSVVSRSESKEDRELSVFDLESDVMTFDGRPFSVNQWIDGPDLTEGELAAFKRVILETFSTKELAIYLAFPVRMMSHETLLRACGVGKTRIADIWKEELFGKKIPRLLSSNLPVDFDTPEAHRLLQRIAEEELRRHPAFSDFLEAYHAKTGNVAEK